MAMLKLKWKYQVAYSKKTKEPIDDWKKEVKNLVKDPKNSKKAFVFMSSSARMRSLLISLL